MRLPGEVFAKITPNFPVLDVTARRSVRLVGLSLLKIQRAGMMNGVVRREKGVARTGPARAGDESSPLCSEVEARASTYKKILVVGVAGS